MYYFFIQGLRTVIHGLYIERPNMTEYTGRGHVYFFHSANFILKVLIFKLPLVFRFKIKKTVKINNRHATIYYYVPRMLVYMDTYLLFRSIFMG